ncbi:hypothetical protein ACFSCX_23965 [Bacillus salitolerans]|uniref:Uncharacterized protein n=1 Tax=Bacillus salitolerans TaxID=1437434 RepID=A0ABW4LYP2_9BACI
MNKSELKSMLEIKQIPTYYYNLDGIGEVDQRVCLEKEGQEWIVFYSERGKRFDIKRFNTEDEACQDILNRLVE